MSETCEVEGRGCGTPNGWRKGGRCWRCRIAHNAETSRYRGLTEKQRTQFLSLLRFGRTIDQAAASAGVSRRKLTAAATLDGELRAAMDGLPAEIQRAARLGDYLAALTRTGGDRRLAATICGMTRDAVNSYRADDETFAAAEAAVLAMVGTSPLARAHVTDAQLDEVARLLEGGASIAKAAEAAGVTDAKNVRLYARRHPRLAAALPPRKHWEPKTTKKSPERLARLRKLWADETLAIRGIAKALGVSETTTRGWAYELKLPPRSQLARRKVLEERRQSEAP